MMAEAGFFTDLLGGWGAYQQLLVDAVRPLTAEQLALGVGRDLRSAGEIAAHIVRTRAGWLLEALGDGVGELERWTSFGREGSTVPSAEELVAALEASWQPIKAGLERWTAADYAQSFTSEEEGETWTITRGWVIWHLIEHDVHHGGELSMLLGSHGLRGVEID